MNANITKPAPNAGIKFLNTINIPMLAELGIRRIMSPKGRAINIMTIYLIKYAFQLYFNIFFHDTPNLNLENKIPK